MAVETELVTERELGGSGEPAEVPARSRVVTAITAIAIAVCVALAAIMISGKLSATEDRLGTALAVDTKVCDEAGTIKTYCRLDQGFAKRRYALAEASVSAALWTRFFLCIGGLILVAVGSIFIVLRLEIAQSVLEAKGSGVGVGLRTSSPGLALTLLGGALLAAAAYTPARFDMTDGPSYLAPARSPINDFSDVMHDDGPPSLPAQPQKSATSK